MGRILEKGASPAVDLRLLRALPAGVESDPDVDQWARRLAPSFYLDVGNVCNQRCLYCAVPREDLYRTPCAEAVRLTREAVATGYTTATFIGGEPTIWPHLSASLRDGRAVGMERAILTTNGLMLAYRPLLERLLSGGVDVVGLSFDDFDPEVQRRLAVRQDNPEVLAQAVENLASAPVATYFYTVVTGFLRGRAREHAAQALQTAQRFGHPPAFVLAGLKPVALARESYADLAISLTQTAAEVATVLEALAGKGRVAFRDIPLCLLPDHLPYSLDLYHVHASLELSSGDLHPAPLAADRVYVAACEGCRLREWCPAIYRAYLDRYGEGEFVRFE